MAEIDPMEEKALCYLLGRLAANEAREFERRMETSPELMNCVRELEEGAVALALACPPKRPPTKAWENIERAIENDWRVIVRWEWFRDKGWAAAAACVVGWLLYAVLTQWPHSNEQNLASSPVTAGSREAVSDSGMNPVEVSRREQIGQAIQKDFSRSDIVLTPPPAELAILRTQVAQLRGDLAQISQAVTQQQALLNDPGRLKFIGLAPVSNGTLLGTNALSPSLQHAISVAMARELGWLGNSNVVTSVRSDEVTRGAVTNVGGVDFVDLRPQQSTNIGAPTPLKAPAAVELAQVPDTTPTTAQDISTPSTVATNVLAMLPAFASADHVTVAMDNSVAPPGSFVTMAMQRSNGALEVIGGALLGNNPMVLTFNSVNFSGRSETALFQPIGEGVSFIVTSITPGGATNQFQFITTPTP